MKDQLTAAEFKKLLNSGKIQTKGSAPGEAKAELGKIIMALRNEGVSVESEVLFHPERKWRFDYAIASRKIAIEYEGIFSEKSRHTGVVGFTEDCNKYNEAQLLGWRVFRVTALNISGFSQVLRRAINQNCQNG
ncbi:MAG: hypothetical protein JNM00_04990 [Flavobacteriales bacterium]|nr:hypothetical protein [Flavobacteriales bacterium]